MLHIHPHMPVCSYVRIILWIMSLNQLEKIQMPDASPEYFLSVQIHRKFKIKMNGEKKYTFQC